MIEEIINGINYRLNEETLTAEVIKKEGYEGNIIIPETVVLNEVTYRVTSIGEYAFSHCSALTSITIPNSVTKIGNCAFKGCSALTSITIPNSVTEIGYEAFCECKNLTTVTLPAGVDKIDDHAFWWCNKLKTIYVPAKKTEYYMKRLPKHLQWKIVEME